MPSPETHLERLVADLGLASSGVAATLKLLADGGTVPFIARYRKEATGGFDEVQIREIEERGGYLKDLEARRTAILESVGELGVLTTELRQQLMAAQTKTALEYLYAPHKPKRQTRGRVARARGLAPLAERILAQPRTGDPRSEARPFVSIEREVPDVDAALAGARDIVAETTADKPRARAYVRGQFGRGRLTAKKARGVGDAPTKFERYYEFSEPLDRVPPHRAHAVLRGVADGVLKAKVEVDEAIILDRIRAGMGFEPGSPFAGQMDEAVTDSYRRLLSRSAENEVLKELKERADATAIDVFGDNLRNLLLAAPLGERSVVGIDPGQRTGCKCAAVDATGRYLGTDTFYLLGRDSDRAGRTLSAFLERHEPGAVAVGNGTGGREAEAFVRKLLADAGRADVLVVSVNEAGASVYSASDIAREELGHLDLTIRGAVSIARRLQDPLAELVKVDPKAIGVGQYQHDVDQARLKRRLDVVVESCVNSVGVELNTASAPLLAHVAGVSAALAKKIVAHRSQRGAFRSRKDLLSVSGLGPKAFEQCAGFLRVRQGRHPLDRSAVHPERYALVERMAADQRVQVGALIGDAQRLQAIDLHRYIGGDVGEPTLRDIVDELARPGRDPRGEFEPPRFRDDVHKPEDLREGMQLEGVVTNVTNFGAFVDVGVHQDGLVHISQLADRFVRDPHEVVRVGDKLQVRVLEVDLQRRRISLTAQSEPQKPR